MLEPNKNQSVSRKTYSKRRPSIGCESLSKRKCIEKIISAQLDSLTDSSVMKVTSSGYSESSSATDIRNFFLPTSSPLHTFNPKIELSTKSLPSRQVKKKKRRLRLTWSEAKESASRPTENHVTPRLIQQTIGSTRKEFVNCKTCGMIYAFWEEKNHNLYHQKLSLEFQPVIRCKNATIYEQNYEDSILRMQVLHRNMEKNLQNLGEIALQHSSNNGLEMEHIKSNILWGLIPDPHNPSDSDQVFHYKLYLMFHGSQLIGLLLAERIGYAELRSSEDLMLKECGRPRVNAEVSRNETNGIKLDYRRKIFMSIERIWVHQKYQRKGLATRIIDEARRNFLSPLILCKNEVAISWPTDDGDGFFKKYFRGVFESSECGCSLPYLINHVDTTALRTDGSHRINVQSFVPR